MTDKCILIISDMEGDLHAAVIKSELKKRNEHVICIDPKDILDGEVEFDLSGSSPTCSVRTPEIECSANSIKSILYRRPSLIQESRKIEEDYRLIVREEWISFIQGLWEFFDNTGVLWVSHPANIKRAEAKLRQLETTHRLGMRVARTIVTNKWDRVQQFFRQTHAQIIMKKLKSHSIAVGDHTALFVAKILDDPSGISQDDLAVCPIIFQEYIPKAFDVRLVVVGQAVFAVKIYSQATEQTRIDYRAGKEQTQELIHEHYQPPDTVSLACRTMLKEFGLNFGAFDFVVSSSGEHIFLELNPNGQWLWLQLATKTEISNAFCDLLGAGVS